MTSHVYPFFCSCNQSSDFCLEILACIQTPSYQQLTCHTRRSWVSHWVQDLPRTCCKAGSQPDVLAQLQSRLLAKVSAAGKLSWFKVLVQIRAAPYRDLFPLGFRVLVLTCPTGNLLELVEYRGVSSDFSWSQSLPVLLDHNLISVMPN